MADRRSRKTLAAAALFALVPGAAGCSNPVRTSVPQTAFAGPIAIERVYSSGRVTRQSGTVTQTPAFEGNRIALHEQVALAGRITTSTARADFQPARGGFRGFTWRDSAGNAVAMRFAYRSPQLIVQDFSHALQSNRAVRSDGSYREIANAVAKTATVVSTIDSAARGTGSWKVEIFPHTSEAGSTYYGFLNDAKIEYDFAVRAAGSRLHLFGNGGFASGYSERPALRDIAALPSSFAADGSSYRRTMQAVEAAAVPRDCTISKSARGLRSMRESLLDTDALSGTVESIDTQTVAAPNGGIECISIAGRSQYFPLSRLRAGVDYLRSIAISETLALKSPGAGETIPAAYAALVREDVLAMLSAEIAQSRTAALRELAATRPVR